MTIKPSWKPWHEVVQLRGDLKTGELSLAVFAADLYDVVMQKGQRPVYEHPAEFFALTYPTYNLRELVKEVALQPSKSSKRTLDSRRRKHESRRCASTRSTWRRASRRRDPMGRSGC